LLEKISAPTKNERAVATQERCRPYMASVTGSPVTNGTLGIHREVIAKRLAQVQYNDDEERSVP
jgi:hypothetical protein